MIDNEKNVAFWDRAAHQAQSGQKAFAGMLMEGRTFEAIYRCLAEQERFLSINRLTPLSRVLEVGSGGGRWAYFLADKVGSYVGLDISPMMVVLAQEEARRRNLANVHFKYQGLVEFESTEQFDLVYFSGVLQYMDDDVVKQCITKASRLLSPRGVVVSRDSVQLNERVEKSGDYPVIYRTPDEYLALFEAGGFRREYMKLSYQHKRFTKTAARLYGLPFISYGMAYTFREGLCAVDNLLGNPDLLKTERHKKELQQANPQEHRFFKYVRR